MFGKRKSSNDSFVMAAGRKAGNLKETLKKSPTAQPPKNSGKSKGATAPVVMKVSQRQKLGSLGKVREQL